MDARPHTSRWLRSICRLGQAVQAPEDLQAQLEDLVAQLRGLLHEVPSENIFVMGDEVSITPDWTALVSVVPDGDVAHLLWSPDGWTTADEADVPLDPRAIAGKVKEFLGGHASHSSAQDLADQTAPLLQNLEEAPGEVHPLIRDENSFGLVFETPLGKSRIYSFIRFMPANDGPPKVEIRVTDAYLGPGVPAPHGRTYKQVLVDPSPQRVAQVAEAAIQMARESAEKRGGVMYSSLERLHEAMIEAQDLEEKFSHRARERAVNLVYQGYEIARRVSVDLLAVLRDWLRIHKEYGYENIPIYKDVSRAEQWLSQELGKLRKGDMPSVSGEEGVTRGLNKLVAAISYALNVAHHNGRIGQSLGLTGEMLDQLSMMDYVPERKYLRKEIRRWVVANCRLAAIAPEGDVGYDPSWGEHHGEVEFKPDYFNYGPRGWRGSNPPMPLPKKLYHATPFPERVLEEGFKAFKDPSQQVFGGHGTYTSLTTLPNARVYAEGLRDAIRVARGEVTGDEELLALARKWGAEDDRARAMLESSRFRCQHDRRDVKDQDACVARDFLGVMNIVSDFPYIMDFYNQADRLAQMSPEDVAILEVDVPRMDWSPGMMGDDISERYTANPGETEWRVHTPSMLPRGSIRRLSE